MENVKHVCCVNSIQINRVPLCVFFPPSPKVSRNFELVGRVNLDQLEQMKEKEESSSSDEEEKEEEMSPKEEESGQ